MSRAEPRGGVRRSTPGPLAASGAVAFALALAAPSAARAEERPRGLFLGVSVEELYDSNVMNGRGPDAVTRVTPRAAAALDSRRVRAAADYRIGLHGYARGTARSSINHRAVGRVEAQVTRRVTAGASAMLVMGDDPILLERAGVAIPEGGFVDVLAGGDLSIRLARRWDARAAYELRRSRFELADDPAVLARDGDEHRLDLEASHVLTRRFAARAYLRGQHFVAFPSAMLPPGEPTDGLGSAVGGGLGGRWVLSRAWRAQLQAGPIWFERHAALTWTALGELRRTGETTRLALRGVRELYGGTGANEAVWSESVYLSGVWRLGRRSVAHARAGAFRGGPAPRDPAGVSGLVAGAAAGWLLWGDALRLDLYAEHRAQDGAGGTAFDDIQRTLVGVRLVGAAGGGLLEWGETP